MTPDIDYLSKEKHKELEKELQQLKTVRRQEIANDLEFAKSLGDLSENAEYQQAREAQANLEDRINQIEMLLKSAIIVSDKHKSDSIGIGSVVEVKKEGSNDTQKYQLVGSEEADMAAGKLSIKSPLGEALYEKKKGETAIFKAPNGKDLSYIIVSIE
ncbi:MAG: transcription elongation factor GreA [Parcubacteria group bacterium]|nr:transcription elongation factor GreA [Parcubacteria group bacterium]